MKIESQRFTLFTMCIASLIVGLAFLAFMVMPRVHAAPGSGERLVMIHDRGIDRGVITRASTLRAVFKEADIALDQNDLVEPGLDEELVTNNYQVNVYRARPIIIVDGPVKQLVMSAYQTPKQIAKNAGIILQDEDEATLEVTNNMVSDGASLRMIVDRATPIRLVLYGKKEVVYTQEETVAAFLKDKEITLGKKDTLSVKQDKPITANMKIEIWRNGKQTVTSDESVAFAVKQIQDTNREVGYKKIVTPGIDGKKSVTYEIVMKNGKEASRKVIQSVVTKKPSEQVEIIGAKVKSYGGSCGSWMAAAGITDIANATYLINAESHCNPNAVNASSGACGVGQALPCSKTGCAMGDGACQTAWMNSYVLGRYGSWANAANHHRSNGWY